MKDITFTFIMTALNEENNIKDAIHNTLNALNQYKIKGDIIVINDGSTDKTKEIITEYMKKDKRIITIDHEKPHGVGASFWDGVKNANGDIVCCIPGDNENDPKEVLRYFNLCNEVDIIVPFIFNKNVRSFFRRVLSDIYRAIINTTFGINLNYTNGTVLYRRIILNDIELNNFGFLYQAELLIRLIRIGYLYAEVPCGLSKRNSGKSKALTFKSFRNVVKGYLKLIWDILIIKKDKKKNISININSITAKRRNCLSD